MPAYRVLKNYRSSLASLVEDQVVDLTEDVAEHIERDSEGTLELDVPVIEHIEPFDFASGFNFPVPLPTAEPAADESAEAKDADADASADDEPQASAEDEDEEPKERAADKAPKNRAVEAPKKKRGKTTSKEV